MAYTYNDPVIFLEFAVDVAAAARALGLRNVAVTAGYIEPAPRAEFFAAMDAANIDLKAFDRRLSTGGCARAGCSRCWRRWSTWFTRPRSGSRSPPC
jgi:pyruvate formate lyase activating enzyme